MTRRSCAIYATGIVCAHLLIVGIALLVAQVFQTMIHNRLKKVSVVSSFPPLSFTTLTPFHSVSSFKASHLQWTLLRIQHPAAVC